MLKQSILAQDGGEFEIGFNATLRLNNFNIKFIKDGKK